MADRIPEFNEITCGIYECIHLLETHPEEVCLCILPSMTSTDLTIPIEQKLIEAFCSENSIRIVRVNGTENLEEHLRRYRDSGTHCNCEMEVSRNLTCTLLSYHVHVDNKPADRGNRVDAADHSGTCNRADWPQNTCRVTSPD